MSFGKAETQKKKRNTKLIIYYSKIFLKMDHSYLIFEYNNNIIIKPWDVMKNIMGKSKRKSK